MVNISTTGTVKTNQNSQPSLEDFFNFPFNVPRQQQPSERTVQSLGSGFVISEDGYIVTNNHVVENATDITATFTDGLKLEAVLIATDKETEIQFKPFGSDKYAVMLDTVLVEEVEPATLYAIFSELENLAQDKIKFGRT